MIAQTISNGLFLGLVAGIPLIGAIKKVPVYDTFVEGAKEGFEIIIRIVPYLVAMIVAIGLLRTSGLLQFIESLISPVLSIFRIPTEILPMALVRPFSGTAAIGVMAEIMKQHGGDAYLSKLAAVVMGSTETTFYVLAVYFGSVGILRTRHAVLTGLLADAVGVIAACFMASLFFMHA